MAPKGKSIEEKKELLRQLFVETKDVFTLKDLEKIAPKQKGIITQSVKDVLTMLVDERIVKNEKVGASQFFWLFPSDDYTQIKVANEKAKSEVSMLKRKTEENNTKIAKLKVEKADSEERTELLSKLSTLRSENTQLKEQLRGFAENNPELLEAMTKDSKTAIDSANRWTDNIWSIQSWCFNKMNIDKARFAQNFGIANLDYYGE